MQRRASSSYGATIAPRRAHVEARVARAAVIGDRRVDRQRQVRVDLAEQEPRARVAIDAGSCACRSSRARRCGRAPSRARARCRRTRDSRTSPMRSAIAIGEPLQPRAQHLVIVAPERVARDVAACVASASVAARVARICAASSPCAPRSRARCPARAAPGRLRLRAVACACTPSRRGGRRRASARGDARLPRDRGAAMPSLLEAELAPQLLDVGREVVESVLR